MSSQETASIRQTAEYLVILAGILVEITPLDNEALWEQRLTYFAHDLRGQEEAISAAIDIALPKADNPRTQAIVMFLHALRRRIQETLPPSPEQLEHAAKVQAWIEANVNIVERYVQPHSNFGRQTEPEPQGDE